MSVESAKALHDRQRHYDELHHLMRLDWLTSTDRPEFVCGTPVLTSDVVIFIAGSHECLRLIQQHGMSTNSVSLDNAEYIAKLDAFSDSRQSILR